MILWVDFETRSKCDLKKHGVYNYAQDGTTEVLCMSYAFDDEDVVTWTPDQPFPERVRNHTGEIRAHNAAFERLIFDYVLQIPFKLEQFYCTAAQARANCAPGSLEDVGRFAGASMKKDHRGAQLIRLLSMPRADGTFNTSLDLMSEMVAYCEMDVKAMRAVSLGMRQLSKNELHDYHVNERINDRGVLVDVPLAAAAINYAAHELEEIQSIVREVTQGAITSVRSPKMREWVKERVGKEALKLMEVEDGKYSIDKTVRANLLAMDDPEQVPPDVAEVIQCADDMFSSSVAKFSRLANLADVEDYRLRGAFIFAGGSATGRYSSTGAQLQNMSRICAEDPDAVRHAMVRGHEIVPKFGVRITDVLKGMLRPTIMAPKGRKLISLDWSGIEARMTPWCSSDPLAESTLDIFRSGKDIYISTAAAMFNKSEDSVTKQDRMLGKVSVLACGFGGGVGAFAAMGKIYGVNLPEVEAKRIINLWRSSNTWAVLFWRKLENAMKQAMRHPGYSFSAGKVTYLRHGDHLWYELPSGRVLCYPYVRFDEDGEVSYAKAAWKPAAGAKEWPRARLWVGVLIENLVQASANCILRNAIKIMDSEGLHIVGTVHDEIIVECDDCVADDVRRRMKEIMTTPPEWAKELPLDVEGDIMQRFSK